jgi:hypothetical protein
MFFNTFNSWDDRCNYNAIGKMMESVTLEFGHLNDVHGRQITKNDVGKKAIKIEMGWTSSGTPNTSYVFGFFVNYKIYSVHSFGVDSIGMDFIKMLSCTDGSDSSLHGHFIYDKWVFLDEVSEISRRYIEMKADNQRYAINQITEEEMKEEESIVSDFVRERTAMQLEKTKKKETKKQKKQAKNEKK